MPTYGKSITYCNLENNSSFIYSSSDFNILDNLLLSLIVSLEGTV